MKRAALPKRGPFLFQKKSHSIIAMAFLSYYYFFILCLEFQLQTTLHKSMTHADFAEDSEIICEIISATN
jgi:hypothetical protein